MQYLINITDEDKAEFFEELISNLKFAEVLEIYEDEEEEEEVYIPPPPPAKPAAKPKKDKPVDPDDWLKDIPISIKDLQIPWSPKYSRDDDVPF